MLLLGCEVLLLGRGRSELLLGRLQKWLRGMLWMSEWVLLGRICLLRRVLHRVASHVRRDSLLGIMLLRCGRVAEARLLLLEEGIRRRLLKGVATGMGDDRSGRGEVVEHGEVLEGSGWSWLLDWLWLGFLARRRCREPTERIVRLRRSSEGASVEGTRGWRRC